MGYLDNTTVTVDAILTNKGRQLLAAGGQLNVVKFAVADDEIDYDLYNPAHTLGTNYYGAVIENMPVLEALPDETQMMRYKLLTLPKDVIGIPVISLAPSSVSFTSLTQEVTITPSTLNLQNGNGIFGYTAILSDDTVATLMIAPNGKVNQGAPTSPIQNSLLQDQGISVTNFLDDELTGISTTGKTVTKIGTQFVIKPKPQANTTQIVKAVLTVVGNETGGFKTIIITVDPSNFLTLDIQTSIQ